MRFLLVLIVASVLLSCSKEVELNQPSYLSKVVVDGYIESGRSAHIHLTLSSPYLTHYDSASILNTFLNHAKITVTSSKGEEEVLTIFRESRFFPPFVYKSTQLKGEVGVRYNLKIEVNNRVVTASTTIPPAPRVLHKRFLPQTDTTGYPEYIIEPSSEGAIYLFTMVESSFSKEAFHPSFHGVTTVAAANRGEWIWNRIFRVREMRTYSSNPEALYYNSYPKFHYDLRDTIQMIPGAVDSISYRVLKSLFTDLTDNENPFSFNGNRIITNIQGGIGRWTGIGISPLEVITFEEP